MAPFQVQSSAPDPQVSAAQVAPIDWVGAVKAGIELRTNLETVELAHEEARQRLEFNAQMNPVKLALRETTLARQKAELPAQEAEAALDLAQFGSDLVIHNARNQTDRIKEAEQKLRVAELERKQKLQDGEDEQFDAVLGKQMQKTVQKITLLLATGDSTEAARLFVDVQTKVPLLRSATGSETAARAMSLLKETPVSVPWRGETVQMDTFTWLSRLGHGVAPDAPYTAAGQAADLQEHRRAARMYGETGAKEGRRLAGAIATANTQIEASLAADPQLQALETETRANAIETMALQSENALSTQQASQAIREGMYGDAGDPSPVVRDLVRRQHILRDKASAKQRVLLARQKAAADERDIPLTLGGRVVGDRQWGVSPDADIELRQAAELRTIRKKLWALRGDPEAQEHFQTNPGQLAQALDHVDTLLGGRIAALRRFGRRVIAQVPPSRLTQGVHEFIFGAEVTNEEQVHLDQAALKSIYETLAPNIQQFLMGTTIPDEQRESEFLYDQIQVINTELRNLGIGGPVEAPTGSPLPDAFSQQ